MDLGSLIVNIETNLSALHTGLRDASSALSTWANQSRSRLRAFEDSAVALGAAAAGLGLALGASSKAFGDFEAKLNGVASVSGATASEMERVKAAALQMGADTQFSSAQAADGFYELGKAGFTVSEQLATMPGVIGLAGAAQVSIGEASETTAGILRGFGLAASEATNVADQLAQAANSSAVDVSDMGEAFKYIAPIARASNQSLSEMSGILAVLGNNQIKGSQAGTTIRSALVALQKPTDDSAKILNRLGVSIQDTSGRMLPLTDVINQLRDKMSGYSETQRSAALATIFGQESLSGMMALINQAPGAVEKMVQAQANATGAAQTMADGLNKGLNFQLQQLGGSVETLAIQIGEDLSGAIGVVNNALTGLVNFLGTIPAPIRQFGAMLAGAALVATSLAAAIGGLAAALPALAAGFAAMTGPVGLAVIGVSALVAGGLALAGAFSQTKTATLGSSQAISKQIGEVQRLEARFVELKNKTHLTKVEEAERQAILEKLEKISPSLVTGYDEQGRATDVARDATERYITALKEKLRLENEGLLAQANAARAMAAAKRIEMQEAAAAVRKWEAISAKQKAPVMAGGQGFVSQDVLHNLDVAKVRLASVRTEADALTKSANTLRDQYQTAIGNGPATRTGGGSTGGGNPNRGNVVPPPGGGDDTKTLTGVALAEAQHGAKLITDHQLLTKLQAEEVRLSKAKLTNTQEYLQLRQEIASTEQGISDQKKQAAQEEYELETARNEASQGGIAGQLKATEKLRNSLAGIAGTQHQVALLDTRIAKLRDDQAKAGVAKSITEAKDELEQALLVNEQLGGSQDGIVRAQQQYVEDLKAAKAPAADILKAEIEVAKAKTKQADEAKRQANEMARVRKEAFDTLKGLGKSLSVVLDTSKIDDLTAKLAAQRDLVTQLRAKGAPVGDIEQARTEADNTERELKREQSNKAGAMPGFVADNFEMITQIPALIGPAMQHIATFGASLAKASDGVMGFLGGVWPAIAGAFGQLTSIFSGGLLSGLGSLASGILPAIGGALSGLAAAIIPLLPVIAAVVAAFALVQQVWTQNAGGIQEAVGNILTGLQGVWDGIVAVVQPLVDVVGSIAAVLANVFGGALALVGAALQGLGAFLTWVLKPILDPIASVFRAINDAIVDFINWLADVAPWLGIQKMKKEGDNARAAEADAKNGLLQSRTIPSVPGLSPGKLDTPKTIGAAVSQGVKDALGSLTSFNPLPVEDVARGNFFATGPASRFFIERESRVSLELNVTGMADKASLVATFNDPAVRSAITQAVGQENAAVTLTPKFA